MQNKIVPPPHRNKSKFSFKSGVAIAALVLTLTLTTPHQALADCTTPASPAGGFNYVDASTGFEWCNGTTWQSMLAGTGSLSLNDLNDAIADYLDSNIFIGEDTGTGIVTGTANNTIIGIQGFDETTTDAADNNTGLGFAVLTALTSGANNTALGYQAGGNITTGTGNIMIGYNVEASLVGVDDELNIGNTIYGDLSAGYVGIGTASPTALLDISGGSANQVVVQDENGDSLLTVSGEAGAPGGAIKIGDVDAAASSQIFTTDLTNGDFTFENGNVGIRTASPDEELHLEDGNLYITNVSGGAAATSPSLTQGILEFDNTYDSVGNTTANKIVFYDNTTTQRYGIGVSGSDLDFFSGSNFRFYADHEDETTPGTEAFTILENGNVGIGTDDPNRKLEVSSLLAGGEVTNLRLTNTGTTANTSSSLAFTNTSADVESGKITTIRTNSPVAGDNSMLFSTYSNGAVTEHMRINALGNVGIGETGPSFKLDVAGTLGVSNQVTLSGYGSDTYPGTAARSLSVNSSGEVIEDKITKAYQAISFDFTEFVVTGDGAHYFHVPADFNGMNLIDISATVITAGTTGTTDIQLHNVTDGVDMLSTKLTIDSGETGSSTAATAAVINASNDDVATNDLLRIDVDAVSTTPPQGLIITARFETP